MITLAAIQPLIKAALQAVDPYHALLKHVQRHNSELRIADLSLDLEQFQRIYAIGAGKAGARMAQALERVLGEVLTDGRVVVKWGHDAPTKTIQLFQAGHPLPDAAGLAAGAEILALAEQAQAGDLVFCLLSGGGSALLECFPDPLTLADLQTTTDLLLACGASIDEFNTVRKHLSLVKGGQLARAVSPATLITLVLSDVVGSPLAVIASGPTVPDPSTWQQAWTVIEKYDLAERLPSAVRQRLQAGLRGELPDTPKEDAAFFRHTHAMLIGDNAMAAEAASEAARELGYHTQILSTFVEGEAREVGKVAVALGREVQSYGRPVAPPACLILGGETTVSLGEEHGLGGRNQELALAAALALDGLQGITVVALATDGTDGPTDAAGAWVNAETVARGRALGLDAARALAQHDAYPYLQKVGALLHTGPTLTNVNDLLFILVT